MAALIGCDVFTNGALTHLDLRVHDWAIGAHWPDLRPLAATVVLAGQRGPAGAVVGVVVAWTARRLHSWRPLLLPASAVVALNLVVGALKVVIGRSGPYTGRDVFFVGGMEFPSGHASNAVLMWGSLAVVLATSGLVRHRRALVAGVVTVTAVVSGACIVLDTHWLSDLVAGWLVGGALLAILCAILRPSLSRPDTDGAHREMGRRDLAPANPLDQIMKPAAEPSTKPVGEGGGSRMCCAAEASSLPSAPLARPADDPAGRPLMPAPPGRRSPTRCR